jgi:hypothetical protein
MTLTVFIALCLVGCGFMLYVLLQWIRDTQPKVRGGDRPGLIGSLSTNAVRRSRILHLPQRDFWGMRC